MASLVLIGLMLVSGTISLVLIVGVVRSSRSRLDKAGGILLLLVPLVGPLLYWFVYFEIPPQRPDLQNRGPRGDFTHSWITQKPRLDEALRRLNDAQSQGDDKQDDK